MDEELFECNICLQEYDGGYMRDRWVCTFCADILPVQSPHPVNGKPHKLCGCGKIWNQDCAKAGIFGDKNHQPKNLEATK